MTTDASAPMTDEPRRVGILQERPGGPVEIVIDGVDVSRQVAGIHLSLDAADRVPHVVVELTPRVAADGTVFDGMARVAIGEPLDPGPAAAAFLDAMDPGELEKAALNRPDLEPGPGGLTAAMLRQLVEWASGRP